MDAHLPEDLRALERRLAGWQPELAALNADRMLFAAGRASARPGWSRLLWPAAAACLAALAAGLGVGLVQERAERQALARALQLRPLPQPPAVPRSTPPAADEAAEMPLSPASYLAARRALERDPDGWAPSPSSGSAAPPAPAAPILRAWGPGNPIDP
jgi:hypothetical protein